MLKQIRAGICGYIRVTVGNIQDTHSLEELSGNARAWKSAIIIPGGLGYHNRDTGDSKIRKCLNPWNWSG